MCFYLNYKLTFLLMVSKLGSFSQALRLNPAFFFFLKIYLGLRTQDFEIFLGLEFPQPGSSRGAGKCPEAGAENNSLVRVFHETFETPYLPPCCRSGTGRAADGAASRSSSEVSCGRAGPGAVVPWDIGISVTVGLQQPPLQREYLGGMKPA